MLFVVKLVLLVVLLTLASVFVAVRWFEVNGPYSARDTLARMVQWYREERDESVKYTLGLLCAITVYVVIGAVLL